jgi:hypothetical protein
VTIDVDAALVTAGRRVLYAALYQFHLGNGGTLT